jgi:hypothetical protein
MGSWKYLHACIEYGTIDGGADLLRPVEYVSKFGVFFDVFL